MTERAVLFDVEGERLVGILHAGAEDAHRGVLVVVGGPQYRVGSHRQFLLLARYLAERQVPVFRFDYRGMGDSSGAQRDFEGAGEDIRGAVDTFVNQFPKLREIVIWGLCDAASAALLYAWRDPRVTGLVLLNPWVRTEEGLAKVYLKRYYLQRFASRDFWAALLRGRINLATSVYSLAEVLTNLIRSGAQQDRGAARSEGMPQGTLPERMAEGWKRYSGPILLILSGDDLTAAEFRDVAGSHPSWRGLLSQPRVTLHELPGANHTCSTREWRDQVAQWTFEWV